MRRFLNKNSGSAAQISFVVPVLLFYWPLLRVTIMSFCAVEWAKDSPKDYVSSLHRVLFILHVLLHHSQFNSYSLIV